jgi:hypothetical protein
VLVPEHMPRGASKATLDAGLILVFKAIFNYQTFAVGKC